MILRIATILHMLFAMENDEVTDEVTEEAIKAAINFVKIACQQTALIAGRGTIEEEVKKFEAGKLDIIILLHSTTSLYI